MAWSKETIQTVYDRNKGYCMYCSKRFSIEDAIIQPFTGAGLATVSWLLGSLVYARSRGRC